MKPSYSFGCQFCQTAGEDSMSYALKTNDLYQKYAHTHYLCVSVGTRMHPSVDASMCPCKRVCVCVCAEGTGETQALILLRASTDVES